jgi:hypothetical protein
MFSVRYEINFFYMHTLYSIHCAFSGPGTVVGIATGYGLDGPGIECRGGEIFRTCPDRPWGPPSLLYNGYRVYPAGKERPERDADPSLPSSVVVIKEKSYNSTPPMGRTACTEPQCLYKGALYLYLYYAFSGESLRKFPTNKSSN